MAIFDRGSSENGGDEAVETGVALNAADKWVGRERRGGASEYDGRDVRQKAIT